jgi:hypothetical protein
MYSSNIITVTYVVEHMLQSRSSTFELGGTSEVVIARDRP